MGGETMSEWRKVGVVSVDAGMVWIGDPCYLIESDVDESDDSDERPAETWRGFCRLLDSKIADDTPPTKENLRAPTDEEILKHRLRANAQQWQFKAGHDGLGVTVTSGCGDGAYDVFVREDKKGTVLEAKVVFIDEEDEEEEEE
jgi:hypothetical protein